MIDAAEAKRIAEDNSSEIKKQFKDIDKYVTEAAIDGHYSVNMSGRLHSYVKSFLITRGYKIEEVYYSNEPFYTIRWH